MSSSSQTRSPLPRRNQEDVGALVDLQEKARAEWRLDQGRRHTHDSVASGGIWGPQGAGAPHEIHAAFKVSVWGVMSENRETAVGEVP